MKDTCDMCATPIESGACECGTWFSAEESRNDPVKKVLEHFHDMKRFSMTGDAPHLGCAIVMFRGDYLDCKAVEDFICKMKGRPFYEMD